MRLAPTTMAARVIPEPMVTKTGNRKRRQHFSLWKYVRRLAIGKGINFCLWQWPQVGKVSKVGWQLPQRVAGGGNTLEKITVTIVIGLPAMIPWLVAKIVDSKWQQRWCELLIGLQQQLAVGTWGPWLKILALITTYVSLVVIGEIRYQSTPLMGFLILQCLKKKKR